MYWIGRRSRSREKKFVAARALVAELERTLDVVHPSEPAPAGGRYERPDMPASTRTRRAAAPAPAGGSYERTGTGPRPHADPDLHAGRQGIRPPGVPRRAYEGLVASGGMFHLEPTLQARLHAFYDHADRDDRGALAPMIVPLMLDVAGFRDANAPFAWLGLAWPPRRMLSGLPCQDASDLQSGTGSQPRMRVRVRDRGRSKCSSRCSKKRRHKHRRWPPHRRSSRQSGSPPRSHSPRTSGSPGP